MATIRKEISIARPAGEVWSAFSDFGAVHTRLAPGFVVNTVLEEPRLRVVTFANGASARETLVSLEEGPRRLVYAIAPGPKYTHYNAAIEVFQEGAGSRVVWTIDLMPDALADTIAGMVDIALPAMREHLEGLTV
ncbi:MAG: SRPBCC family protein [Hyphomonadaceae bacterium JAD_PAG50586_4]|nr:MAG: SRPBCC family protein [Hyphomonadaceae bacterium JAD_PAG50586_4]